MSLQDVPSSHRIDRPVFAAFFAGICFILWLTLGVIFDTFASNFLMRLSLPAIYLGAWFSGNAHQPSLLIAGLVVLAVLYAAGWCLSWPVEWILRSRGGAS